MSKLKAAAKKVWSAGSSGTRQSIYDLRFTLRNMEHELTLRIVLEKPPAGVDFGLQKGRGSDYETIQKQRSEGKDLHFEFTVRVKAGRKPASPRSKSGAGGSRSRQASASLGQHASAGRGDMPNFLGPHVQGPTGERFIYIDIGTYAGQTQTCWSRRLKIPLSGITWDMIDRVLADGESLLETRVPGTGKDDGPSCATVKPFPGWSWATC